ncbi:MAG: PEGA domain-containing protein [Polyangiaceae bacterium]
MSRALHAASLALCAGALFLTVSPASAQSNAASTGAVDAAKQAFETGNTLAKQLKWSEAAVEYRKAWSTRKAWDISGNLGIAESELKQWPEAAEHLAYGLRHFPPSGKADHRKVLEMRMAEARKHVGTLDIGVDRPGAEVTVDGRIVGDSPLEGEQFVAGGEHVVEAKLAGYAADTKRVRVEVGKVERVRLALVEASAAAPVGTAPVASDRSPSTPELPPDRHNEPNAALLVAGGVTAAAGVAVGIGLIVAGATKFDDADRARTALEQKGGSSACTRPELAAECDAYDSTYADAGTFRNIGIASLIGGVVVGGITATYWLTSRSGTASSTTGVHATAHVGATGGSLSLRGSF